MGLASGQTSEVFQLKGNDIMLQQFSLSARLDSCRRAVLFRVRALLWIAAVVAASGTVRAQSPIGTISNIPLPDNNAFATSLVYDASGDLYAWDGLSVWEQTAGAGAFHNIGSVATGNSADAGPIAFSQDGGTLLLSNGAGGFLGGAYNGVFWTMPAAGGSALQVAGSGAPYTGDAVALPAAATIPGSSTKYIVYQGNGGFSGATVSIFDASTGTDRVVIDNGPGATTSIAINPKNDSLYFGVGYGAEAGNIYSFSLSQIDSAYLSATPLDFLSAGTLFNPIARGSQSGAGMFFDSNGYLFSGGDGITVFRPDGTISYDQAAGAADGYYDALTYDPANNEVLKETPYSASPSTGTLYAATAFETVAPGTWTAISGTGGSWANAANWSTATVPTSGTVSFNGAPSRPLVVTLDGNQSAGALMFDVSGSDGYTLSQGTGGVLTLGTSAGASINVVSGAHTISAPIVLAGSLAASISGGSSLVLSGSVGQDPGISAALNLSGNGQLILSGTDSCSGGTTVSGGTLCVTNSSALAEGASLTIGPGGTFLFDPSVVGGQAVSIPQGTTAAVPEPGMPALLAAAGACLVAGRVRRRRLGIGAK